MFHPSVDPRNPKIHQYLTQKESFYKGLCDNVLLFMKNGIVKFMKDWPLLSVQFEGVIRNALNQIEQDYNAGQFSFESGKDCKDVQEKIVRLRNDVVQ